HGRHYSAAQCRPLALPPCDASDQTCGRRWLVDARRRSRVGPSAEMFEAPDLPTTRLAFLPCQWPRTREDHSLLEKVRKILTVKAGTKCPKTVGAKFPKNAGLKNPQPQLSSCIGAGGG